MTSKLGVFWSVEHRRPQDYEYFKGLQPTVFKILDGGQPDYAFCRDNLASATCIARDWALSEQHSDMLRDPIGTGTRHAQEWNEHQKRLGFDKSKTLILGINEPHIWEPGVSEALRLYTISLCAEASKYGLRVGAMQLSVGWPNNTGPDTPPDWSPFAGVEKAILDNNGALIVHEYWADNGPGENWGWWAGRSLKCPWQVPIIIGECGVDMFVKDTSVGQQRRGWQGHMPPERYAAELAEYVSRMSADPRYVGCAVFASDFQAREWASFDVEPAYQAILGSKPSVPDTPPPFVTHLPAVSNGAATLYVAVPAGANLRAKPNAGDTPILQAVPYGEAVTAHGASGFWSKTTYNGQTGWMLTSLLSPTKPASAPPVISVPEAPTGDNFQRALAFVRRWEGGWADNPADPGGATNKGITIGTFQRWREAKGLPTPTKDDLRNLTDAEANEIYREWYWKASGADKLPWPLCLAQFDTAVNAGVGRAQETLSESDGDFMAYVGNLLTWYTQIPNFETFGRAWTRRRADLLLEASKP